MECIGKQTGWKIISATTRAWTPLEDLHLPSSTHALQEQEWVIMNKWRIFLISLKNHQRTVVSPLVMQNTRGDE